MIIEEMKFAYRIMMMIHIKKKVQNLIWEFNAVSTFALHPLKSEENTLICLFLKV